MKIILSRKGFDSSFRRNADGSITTYGGCPSPILPDGTLLSMPIPSPGSGLSFSDISFAGKTYQQIWDELKPTHIDIPQCHLDPDIRKDIRRRPADWAPCFGQIDAAQTHLENQNVGIGDIFLFFGWFRQTEEENGRLKYTWRAPNLQVIYGYLQIGKIVKGAEIQNYPWHPHSHYTGANNTLYIAADHLLDTDLPGYGTFLFDERYVLTAKGPSSKYLSRSKWAVPEWWKNVNISYHSENSYKDGYFQSAMKGQEFVIADNVHNEQWIRSLV